MVKIAVIIGSTRQGRITDRLAKWAVKAIGQKADASLLDLRDYPMPFLDEPMSPRFNPERHPEAMTQKWLDAIATFDGYVLVTPEYNRSMSAVLKNAIDVIGLEMDNKPVALVGHGSSGGAQAIATLRMALPGVGAVTIPQSLFFSDRVSESFSEDGEPSQELREKPYGPVMQFGVQIDSLLRYTEALKTMREA